MFILHEKTSQYDPLSSCLVDFKGRANVPSIKNFQCIESYPLSTNHDNNGVGTVTNDDDKEVLVQMGKVSIDCLIDCLID